MIRRTRPNGRRASEAGETDRAEIAAEATGWLARRDLSSGELADKLRERGYERDAVAAVIAELLESRVLNDSRYTENFVAYHAGRGHGPFRIRQELRRHRIAEETVQAALDAGQDWQALARKVKQSKFGGGAPSGDKDWARQARFLQYRGFSTDHIRSALGRDLDS